MEFLILAYTFLPVITALTIVEKLSSVKIMLAASFETSVPVIPIATPISLCFKAGASLTPSPVMATISLRFCHASTIRILCSGATRAYTDTFGKISSKAESDIVSNSFPSKQMSPSSKIPISLAIEVAVMI